MLKYKLKVFGTIWVNLLTIFCAVYLFSLTSELLTSEENLSNTLYIGFLGGLFGILAYGFIFWSGYIFATLILDIVLVSKNKDKLTQNLLIEWAIISTPFAYWLIKYQSWIFLVAIIAYLISQLLFRKRRIKHLQ